MTADVPRIRLRIIGVVAVSLLVALVARLWFLQVMNSEGYEQRAIANIERTVKVPAPRGRILDAKGRVLVDNRLVTTVSIDKAKLAAAFPGSANAEARTAMLTRLAVEISKSGDLTKVDQIERELRNSQYSRLGLVPIANDINDDLMVLIGEHPTEFPGVEVSQTTVRAYPYGSLAAHVLGYVGPINDTEFEAKRDSPKGYDLTDSIGKTGVERLFEDVLRGTPGSDVFEVDRQERVIREVVEKHTEPVPGNDIYLTIDIGLQAEVERDLEAALIEAREQTARPGQPEITAPAGAAVVLDPRDGSVRAMASYPTYDPSEFIAGIDQARFSQLNDPANHTPLLNRAIQGEYAPGSTFKLFTAYAAITNGFMGTGRLPAIYQRIDDDGVYELDPCTGDVGCTFRNARDGRGVPLKFQDIDLPAAITVSSDTYFYAIGDEIARSEIGRDQAIQEAALEFGLGAPTGVQLPNERVGRIASRDSKAALVERIGGDGRWYIGDNINAAIGQGYTVVTPLQLTNGYATFANGGTLYAPNVVKQVRDQVTGEVLTDFGPRAVGHLDMPPDARDPILRGLVGVTAQDGRHRGTAFRAFHETPGVDFDLVAWPVAGKTGTAEVKNKADSALFSAFGPATNPQYAMTVVLEESGFGGANAAPVVAKVFDAIVDGRTEHAPLTIDQARRCFALLQAQTAETAETAGSTPVLLPDGTPCA